MFSQSLAWQATISYGGGLDAEQLMVQYGFPVPRNLALPRPLMDRHYATKGDRPADGMWTEDEGRVLMDELFLRSQQRFARECKAAGEGHPEFDMLVRQRRRIGAALDFLLRSAQGSAWQALPLALRAAVSHDSSTDGHVTVHMVGVTTMSVFTILRSTSSGKVMLRQILIRCRY